MKHLALAITGITLLVLAGAALRPSQGAVIQSVHALWWTNAADGEADLWLGSPDAPQAITHQWHSADPILEAALSPNGALLALVTDSPGGQRLWLGDPTQGNFHLIDLAPGLGGLTWDGQVLVYGAGEPVRETPTTTWQTTLIAFHPDSGQRRTLFSPDPGHTAQMLGRDAVGQPVLLYDGRLPTDIQPQAARPSRDGRALLWADRQQVYWGPMGDPAHASVSLPPWKQRCGFAWLQPPDQIVLCKVDATQPRIALWALNRGGEKRLLGEYPLPPGEFPPAPIAFSPDGHWLAMARYPTGFFWLEVQTGTWVTPTTDEVVVRFIGWAGGAP